MKYKQIIIPVALLFLLALASTAFAANYVVDVNTGSSITNGLKPFGTLGQGTTDATGNITTGWATQLQNFAAALVQAGRIISVIMVAVGGVMVAFNLESANKTVWNVILGVGLAINMGSVVFGVFGNYVAVPTDTSSTDVFKVAITGTDEDGTTNYNILGSFMNFYTNSVCAAGAGKLVPIATNLTLILVIIDATIKASTDLLGGDKLKFIMQMCLKTGFMLFLINNWFGGTGLNLMGSLGEAFQDIGFAASGISNGTLQPNDIVNNGAAMFNAVWQKMSFSITSPILSLVEAGMLIALVVIIFLTGLEMFMARIEFYTMALITIPLIPFGAIDQLKFLWEKALGAMFNLAIKLCVICFLQAVTTKTLGEYCESLTKTIETGNTIPMAALIQALLMALMFFFLVKKVPELVQGLLSGNPSLAGGSMIDTAKSVGSKAASTAGGATAAAATIAGSMANGYKDGSVAGGAAGVAGGIASAALGGVSGASRVLRAGVAGAAGSVAKPFAQGMETMSGTRGLLNKPSSIFKSNNSNNTALENLKTAFKSGGDAVPKPKSENTDTANNIAANENPIKNDATSQATSTSSAETLKKSKE